MTRLEFVFLFSSIKATSILGSQKKRRKKKSSERERREWKVEEEEEKGEEDGDQLLRSWLRIYLHVLVVFLDMLTHKLTAQWVLLTANH